MGRKMRHDFRCDDTQEERSSMYAAWGILRGATYDESVALCIVVRRV